MQTVSSYGVELRKQNIPLRQTLGIYRSAVRYLTEIYGQVWKRWQGYRMQRGGLMPQNIWCIRRKRMWHVLISIPVILRCRPISDGLRFSMHLGVYLLMNPA